MSNLLPAPAERPHHPYSPSWLQAGEACPIFQSKESQHVRAIAGTLGHKVIETGEDDARLSDEDAAAAAQCLDFYEQRKSLMQQEALAEGCPVGVSTVTELKECHLEVDNCQFSDAKATTAGYVDDVILNWNITRAELFDWKFGMWHVTGAEGNLQGFAYLLGLFKKYSTLQQARFYFKQPLLGYVTHRDFTRDDIAEIYLRVQVVVERARKARSEAAAGDFSMARPHAGVCNFCRHLAVCPKVAEYACNVSEKFYPLALPEKINPSTIGCDPAQSSLAIKLAQVLKVWCDAIKRQVTDKVLRGEAPMPEGHKLQTVRKREIINFFRFRKAARVYLTDSEWEACLETSFGAVEGKISEKAPRGSKEATVDTFRQACLQDGAVVLGEPFSYLKPISVKTETKQIKNQ